MTDRQYKNEIVKRMTALGIYRDEYMPTIMRTARLYSQCDHIEEQFEKSGGNTVIKYTNAGGASNLVKNPYLSARDEVYSQLLQHERELGLTPAALKKIGLEPVRNTGQSALEAALLKMADD